MYYAIVAGWSSSANIEIPLMGATNVLCPNVDLSDSRVMHLTFSSDNVAMNYTPPHGVDPTNRIYYIYLSKLQSSSSLNVRYLYTHPKYLNIIHTTLTTRPALPFYCYDTYA